MDRTRFIPAIVMLTAGFVVCIVTIVNKFTLRKSMIVILLTLIGFLVLGYIIKALVRKFIVLPMIAETLEETVSEDSEDEDEENGEESDQDKQKSEV